MIVCVTGCFDFTSPSELGSVQMLGVRAAPYAVSAGAQAELDFIAAGPEGLTMSGTPGWRIISTPESPALGTIEMESGHFFYRAPADIDEPGIVTLTLDVLVGGVPLNAIKAIGIGFPEIANPTIGELTVGGTPVTDDNTIVVNSSAKSELEVTATLTPDAKERTQLAWYSNFGVADPLRGERSVIEIDADRIRKDGQANTLIVVGRDGLGGIAWRVVNVTFN